MVFLYNLSIRFYFLLVLLASTFNRKAKLWIGGRKRYWTRLKEQIDPSSKIIWFHCSSLGEFEQGRPLIEAFKQKMPEVKILLTFFSPSGYEVRKNYSGADYVFYLPLDTKSNAKQFLAMVKPNMAIFIKYEFWFHFLNQLKKNKIPTYLVSANFRPDQVFFKTYGGWYRKFLKNFTYFFVQNTKSKELLQSIGLTNVLVTGDTRFDRVDRIAAESKEIPLIRDFAGDKRVLVAGSTWPKDEDIILPLTRTFPDVKFVVVPHEVEESHVESIIQKSPVQAVRFTRASASEIFNAQVMIVDTIGLLASIYRYGHIAYIGGGFGVGIHNTLEAAAYGIPVIFGPNYEKFQEAKDLVAQKAGFSIRSIQELEDLLKILLNDENAYVSSANEAKKIVNSGLGATQKIIDEIIGKRAND